VKSLSMVEHAEGQDEKEEEEEEEEEEEGEEEEEERKGKWKRRVSTDSRWCIKLAGQWRWNVRVGLEGLVGPFDNHDVDSSGTR
jgi:hypothetical protein